MQKLKGERNLRVLAQIVLFLSAFSALSPSASPSEFPGLDFQRGGGWEETMLYRVQFSFMVMGLAHFEVFLCLVKDLSGCFSGFNFVHTSRIVSIRMLQLKGKQLRNVFVGFFLHW